MPTKYPFTPTTVPTFKDPTNVFDEAIAQGRLTSSTGPLYAGHYMYMGTVNGRDLFKHIMTRRYLP